MNFIQTLRMVQRRNNSLLSIGLDSDIAKLPASLRSHEDPQAEFNRRIIDSTKDLVCAYKLNIAFYESERMWRTLHATLSHIPAGVITIGDGKRGDIASSSRHQARFLLEDLNFTAATVNPYMGRDSVEPFIARAERGAFILALTSNEGSHDFQYLKSSGRPLYEHVVAKALTWNSRKNIGLVVGATHPGELRRIRAMAPALPILIPGVGAQRGDLEAAVRYGCDKRGLLAVINVGRSIIHASAGEDFAEKAREAAVEFRDRMNAYREKYFR